LGLECLEDRLCLSGNLFVNSFSSNSILNYDGTQGTFLQTVASGAAIGTPIGLAVGPNGDLFISARSTNDVLRYDGNTGAFLGTFVSPGSGGLNGPHDLAFGPDGNLYVDSGFNSSVLRYDGTTGAFLNTFVPQGSGGLNFPHGLTFGPDGNLYVTDVNNSSVLRYNGTTGAFMGAFVPSGSGGLNRATGLVFGSDGNLYVDSFATNNVLRYDGKTGAFLGTFASGGGLSGPQGLEFGPDGNLYVSSFNTNQILRFDGTTGAFISIFASGGGLGGPTYFAFRQTHTTTTVSSSVNPSVFGQSIILTASVSSLGTTLGSPSGTVTFSIDGTAQTPVPLNGSDQATLSTATLSVGSHVVTATYNSSDIGFAASTSTALSEVVNQDGTATAISASADPTVFGQPVTFTASVGAAAAGAGAPTGSVTFSVDGTPQTPVALNNGQASLTTSGLAVGGHTITASYNGDGNFSSSSSVSFAQTVNRASTTTTLVSSADPSVFGQPVTITATVAPMAPGAGMSSGTVTFTIDGVAQPSVSLNNGQATFTTSTLAVGSHTVAVAYSGDGNFNASNSSLSQAVSNADTATTVSSSAAPSVFGQSVLFTATVSAVAPGAGTLTGTVTFTVDGTPQTPISLSNGQATFATSMLSVGSHVITAAYNGDSNFNGSRSVALDQQVNQADTTTALSTSVTPSVFGQAVTFTATVSAAAPGAGTSTGPVTFAIDGTAQTPLTLSNGQATFSTSTLGVGGHTVTVSYGGDGSFKSSAAGLNQTVNKANTTIGFSSSANPSVFGQPVTFTAAVSAVSPGAGTPTGTVIFGIDGVAQSPVSMSSGQASFTTSSLSVGAHEISIAYSGDGNFNASTLDPAVTVIKANAATAVSASAAPSVFGQAVTFTAMVGVAAPGAGTLTGTVTFTIDGVAQTAVPLSNNQAALTTSGLGVGSHLVTAAYSGDGNFNGSTSAALNQAVNKADTTTALSASVTPSVLGQVVTFTAVVNPVAPGAGAPTGTVTFTIDGTAQAAVALVNGQAAFTTSTLTAGSHTIAAAYSGDGSFNSNTATLTQVVNKTDTTIAFSVSVEPSVFGQPISFTAAVSAVISSTGTITGTVTFSVDGTPQSPVTLISGQATFTITTLSVGSHEISMVYSGDSNFNSSFLDPVQTVTKADTTTTVTAPSGSSVFGQPVTLTAGVAVVAPGSGTPTGTVTFTIDGTPQAPVAVNNAQAAFSTSSLAAGSHTVTAAYGGSASFNGSTSSNFTVVVNNASTTTSLSSSANPSLAGQQVTFIATVSSTTQGAGTPTGIVTFTIDGVAQPNVTLNNGQAVLSTTALSVGSHMVIAAYNGTTNFDTSTSPTLTQAVNSVGGPIVLRSSTLQSVFGQAITFTATVNVPRPVGRVAFIVDGKVREAVALKNGQATFTTSKLSVGIHSVTARYNGGGSLSGTVSAALNETVSKAGTTTTVFASALSWVRGKPLTFTAVVAPVAPGAGTPTGKVTFFVDGIPQKPVALHHGRAVFTIWTLGVGSHSITANYSGDRSFNASSTAAALKETISKAATKTEVHSSDDSSKFGQTVTFVATVRAADDDWGMPTGTVTFLVDGRVQVTVDLVDGKGKFRTSKLSVGKHVITAIYNGNAQFAASTSNKFVHKVRSAPSSDE
jgi:hypothetical protein